MFIWNKSFEATYDSSWCYVEKVSWLNVCKPHAVLQQVSSCDVNISSSSWNARHSYVDTAWLYAGKRRARNLPARTAVCNDLAQAIDARSSVHTLGPLASVVSRVRLTVCHACLSEGYHSVVHQVEGLRLCPIHHVPLSHTCPRCHRGLGAFSVQRVSVPFQCCACGASFLKDDFLRPLSSAIRQGEASRIRPFLDWLRQASAVAIHGSDWPPHWRFRQAGERSLRATTFQASLLPCLARVHPWQGGDDYFEMPAAGLALIPIEDASALYAWDDADRGVKEDRQASERMRAFASQVANAVTSAMSQRIDRHHRCLDDVAAMTTSAPVGMEVELSANPEMCGVAQAFVIWTSRLRRFIRDVGLWAGRGWSPALDSSLAAFLRTEMESLFYYGANQVALLQSLRSLTMMQRYAAIRAADYPRLGRPKKRFCHENSALGVKYMFRLYDEGVFDVLRCDQGRYFRQRVDTLRGIINTMVEDVHSEKTA